MNWWYTSKNSPDMWQYGQDECYFLTKGRKSEEEEREAGQHVCRLCVCQASEKRSFLSEWLKLVSLCSNISCASFLLSSGLHQCKFDMPLFESWLILFMCRHVYLSVVCIFWADMDSFGNLMVSSWYSSWFQWCVLHCDSPACVKINLTALHHISQQFFVMSVLGGQPGAQLIALSVKPDRRH